MRLVSVLNTIIYDGLSTVLYYKFNKTTRQAFTTVPYHAQPSMFRLVFVLVNCACRSPYMLPSQAKFEPEDVVSIWPTVIQTDFPARITTSRFVRTRLRSGIAVLAEMFHKGPEPCFACGTRSKCRRTKFLGVTMRMQGAIWRLYTQEETILFCSLLHAELYKRTYSTSCIFVS